MTEIIVPTNIRRSDARRIYLWEHPVAITLAVWATIAGVLILAVPSLTTTAAITQTLTPGAFVIWSLFYAAGGMVMALGMWNLSPRVETMGCCLLAGSQIVNLYAIVDIRGGAGALVSGATGAVAVGLVIRAFTLYRRHAGRGAR